MNAPDCLFSADVVPEAVNFRMLAAVPLVEYEPVPATAPPVVLIVPEPETEVPSPVESPSELDVKSRPHRSCVSTAALENAVGIKR